MLKIDLKEIWRYKMSEEKLNNLIVMINSLKFYVQMQNMEECLDLLEVMLNYVKELKVVK